jgi:hypothetical protein
MRPGVSVKERMRWHVPPALPSVAGVHTRYGCRDGNRLQEKVSERPGSEGM